DGRRDIDAQPASRGDLGVRHARLDLFDIVEHAHGTLVVGGAVCGDGHPPGGAVEQQGLELFLERLHEASHLSLRHAEGGGCLREGTRFDDPHEGLHRGELVHGGGLCCEMKWRGGWSLIYPRAHCSYRSPHSRFIRSLMTHSSRSDVMDAPLEGV